MKNISYFLDEEDKYNQTESIDNEVWDEEVQNWNYKRIPFAFLRSKPFRRSYNNIAYLKEHSEGYDLSDSELTALSMFIMHCSAPFRDDYYGEPIPELALNMFEVLDSVVSKAPATQSKTLFRFCVDEDRHDMKVGDIITFPHNLTCTTDRWDRKDNNIYIIQPLHHDKTRAHDIYKIYPHNEKERQVNFIRGSRFRVMDIENIDGTEYHKFYMIEKDGINV